MLQVTVVKVVVVVGAHGVQVTLRHTGGTQRIRTGLTTDAEAQPTGSDTVVVVKIQVVIGW